MMEIGTRVIVDNESSVYFAEMGTVTDFRESYYSILVVLDDETEPINPVPFASSELIALDA